MRNRILIGISLLTVITIFIIWDAITFKNDVVDHGKAVNALIIQPYIEEKYGEDFGWELKNGRQHVDENRFSPYPEFLENNKRVGVDLSPYVGEYLSSFSFPMKNKCVHSDGNQTFTFVALQVNDKWVGDYIVMDEWIPGAIETISKDDLFKELECE